MAPYWSAGFESRREPPPLSPPPDLVNLTGEEVTFSLANSSETRTFKPVGRATVYTSPASDWRMTVKDWSDWPSHERSSAVVLQVCQSVSRKSVEVQQESVCGWMTDDQRMDLDLGPSFPQSRDSTIFLVNADVAIALLHCGRSRDIMVPSDRSTSPGGEQIFRSLKQAIDL